MPIESHFHTRWTHTEEPYLGPGLGKFSHPDASTCICKGCAVARWVGVDNITPSTTLRGRVTIRMVCSTGLDDVFRLCASRQRMECHLIIRGQIDTLEYVNFAS